VRLSARALEWFEAPLLKRGDVGLLHIYINRTLPQPLKIPCGVAGERVQDGTRVAQLAFRDLSDAVVDMLEKLIFRHHRRRVAGAKTAPP
jgi:hypothetical protein